MRDRAELIANIKSGRSSAHAFILEGGPKPARDGFIDELLSGLQVHGLDIVRMQMSGKTATGPPMRRRSAKGSRWALTESIWSGS